MIAMKKKKTHAQTTIYKQNCKKKVNKNNVNK